MQHYFCATCMINVHASLLVPCQVLCQEAGCMYLSVDTLSSFPSSVAVASASWLVALIWKLSSFSVMAHHSLSFQRWPSKCQNILLQCVPK
jgi:hypothetical protein